MMIVLGTFVLVASANNSWSDYHWARTATPFTLKLGNNVTSAWDTYLAQTSSDWSLSSVLDTVIVTGSTNPKTCRGVKGRVEVCNSKYGNNGWLGVAGIWVSNSHITQGIVKLNDTYFNTTTYNKPEWRNLVMCQEVGHTLGLDHQDENFYNPPLGSCMDYSSDPTPNQHPNQHDYDMLDTIYAHLDSTTTVGQTLPAAAAANLNFDDPGEWGREIRRSSDGRASLFEQDFGNSHKVFTFVFWAEPRN